jgi:hypothetical protein
MKNQKIEDKQMKNIYCHKANRQSYPTIIVRVVEE